MRQPDDATSVHMIVTSSERNITTLCLFISLNMSNIQCPLLPDDAFELAIQTVAKGTVWDFSVQFYASILPMGQMLTSSNWSPALYLMTSEKVYYISIIYHAHALSTSSTFVSHKSVPWHGASRTMKPQMSSRYFSDVWKQDVHLQQ